MDLEQIKEDFKNILEYSQNQTGLNIDNLIREWERAKANFIDEFGGKCIYEFPDEVIFELDDKTKKEKLDNFLENYLFDYAFAFPEAVSFLQRQRDGIYSNQLVTTETIVEKGTNVNITMPKGMKLGRALKYFISDETILTCIQQEMSRLIQQTKIKGRFCLSVHPIDFLSLSENAHNWRSCHALDGEYRGGNISYMVDRSTVICYLKAEGGDTYTLPNFPPNFKWNSKKWRMLLYFSNDYKMFFAGRQYPINTTKALDFLRDYIFPTVFSMNISPWTDESIKHFDIPGVIDQHFIDRYYCVGSDLVKLSTLVKNGEYSLQFNDVLSSSYYIPMYSYRERQNPIWWMRQDGQKEYGCNTTTRFTIGGKCNCLKCNSAPIRITSTILCDSCELIFGKEDNDEIGTCPCCGNRFFIEDGYWISDAEEMICQDCANTETGVCSNCGELFYLDDMVHGPNNSGTCYCSSCAYLIEEED